MALHGVVRGKNNQQELSAMSGLLKGKASLMEILPILIGVIGILIAAYQVGYPKSKGLQIRMESSIALLQDDPLLADDLQIIYLGEKVSGISRADFLMVNSGEIPISSRDVMSPPKITFGPDSDVLSAKILDRDPDNSEAIVSVSEDRKSVSISPALMNPTDSFRVAVYLRKPFDGRPIVQARIEGLKGIEFIDSRPESVQHNKRPSWLVYPVAVFSLLCFILIFPAVKESRIHRKLRKKLKANPELFSNISTATDFRRIVSTEMAFLTIPERKQIEEALDSFEENLDGVSKGKLVSIMESLTSKTGGEEIILYLAPLLACSGGYYVYSQYVS